MERRKIHCVSQKDRDFRFNGTWIGPQTGIGLCGFPHYLQPGRPVADRCHAPVHLLCYRGTLVPVNASYQGHSSSFGVHGGLPTTGVIPLSELDAEAPSFRCLSNLVFQMVRLVIAAELA
jgi:hypothetical protein